MVDDLANIESLDKYLSNDFVDDCLRLFSENNFSELQLLLNQNRKVVKQIAKDIYKSNDTEYILKCQYVQTYDLMEKILLLTKNLNVE